MYSLGLNLSLSGLLALSGCDSERSDHTRAQDELSSYLSAEELLDPKQCQPCHSRHYDEWSRSVHAAASTDPIFRALNTLGQRETEGALGDFCVRCHAPAALALGATTDGLNLSDVPRELQGVTCAYCHQITEVRGAHNNPLTWTRDGVMRGGIIDPEPSPAHRSAFSPLLSGRERASSDVCGSCHDIVTPTGIHLERTYLEWRESVFGAPNQVGGGCISCHMPSRAARVTALTPTRRHHDHLMPGVDPVLTPYEPRDEADESAEITRTLNDAIESELNVTLLSELCAEVGVTGGAAVELYLENVSAGHRFPSGAALDRRLWVELLALDARGEVMWSSGVVPPLTPAVEIERADPSMWLIRDRAFDQTGAETHRFWEIVDVTRGTLPPPTLTPNTPTREDDYEDSHVLKRYRFATPRAIVALELRVKMRPMALELIYELIERGLLSDETLLELPTFELRSARQTWRFEEAAARVTLSGRELLCVPLLSGF